MDKNLILNPIRSALDNFQDERKRHLNITSAYKGIDLYLSELEAAYGSPLLSSELSDLVDQLTSPDLSFSDLEMIYDELTILLEEEPEIDIDFDF